MTISSRVSFVLTFPPEKVAISINDRAGPILPGRTPMVDRSCDEVPADVQAPIADLAVESELVVLRLPGADEVEDLVTARDEQVCDQAAMAAPPERLGAHEARRRLGERPLQGLLPRRRRHPGGVAPERRRLDEIGRASCRE